MIGKAIVETVMLSRQTDGLGPARPGHETIQARDLSEWGYIRSSESLRISNTGRAGRAGSPTHSCRAEILTCSCHPSDDDPATRCCCREVIILVVRKDPGREVILVRDRIPRQGDWL